MSVYFVLDTETAVEMDSLSYISDIDVEQV